MSSEQGLKIVFMFEFVNKILDKNKGKKQYQKILELLLNNRKLEDGVKQELDGIIKSHNLLTADVVGFQKDTLLKLSKLLSEDERISDTEKDDFEKILNYFQLTVADIPSFQGTYNKCRSLYLIEEKNILPTPTVSGLDVVLKKEEIIHWVCPAILKKVKHITKAIGYSGFTGSVTIVRGLRYRSGSLKVSRQTSTVMVDEDTGQFWLTNQRIGYIGTNKNFSLPYNKVLSFKLYKDGI